MADESHLDECYFIDGNTYNCPFCNRRHVAYSVFDNVNFQWTKEKECYAYFVVCHSCHSRSMHLSFTNIQLNVTRTFSGGQNWMFTGFQDPLDNVFFYSVPTSFFVLDSRVPRKLRELLTEAEGCLKSNFLTGASACARKIIYELGRLQGAAGDNYDDRIRSLKALLPHVEPAFFDTLLTIQQVTSTKVHEDSSDAWEAKHLRIILASLREVLHEVYVVPALRA